MNKQEFFAVLTKTMGSLSAEDRQRAMDFFRETIEDRMEEGLTEEEAIASIGDPIEVGREILREFEQVPDRKEEALPETVQEPELPAAPDLRPENTAPARLEETCFTDVFVQLLDGDVEVVPTDGPAMVDITGYEKARPEVTVENGTLKVIQDRKTSSSWFHIIWFREKRKILIKLPKAEYGSVSLKSQSGDMDVTGVHCREMKLHSSSGDMETRECLIQENLKIQTMSGDLELEALTVGQLTEISAVSGDMELKDMKIGALELKSTAGDIDLMSVTSFGNLSVHTTAGDVDLNTVSVGGDLTVNTTAGDIDLTKTEVAGKRNLKTNAGDVTEA